ncbi:AbiTii domain-containing protein, partial [Paenibacillus sp. Marseille-Q9583]
MSRSQLLKDLVGGKTSIESILMRLKIIMSDLDNDIIIIWINGELEGYKDRSEIPSYRILKGTPMGTFIINQNVKYSNSQVPLESLISQEQIDEIITLHMSDGIASIESILSGTNRDNYAKQVPTALCHGISNLNLQIAGMNVMIPSNRIEGVVSQVKSKLTEIILGLEKKFENLD